MILCVDMTPCQETGNCLLYDVCIIYSQAKTINDQICSTKNGVNSKPYFTTFNLDTISMYLSLAIIQCIHFVSTSYQIWPYTRSTSELIL